MLDLLFPDFEFRIKTGELNTHPNPKAPLSNDVMAHFLSFNTNNYFLGPPAPHPFDPSEPLLRTVNPGRDTNVKNNFTWLPYLPGFITYVPFTRQLPIITGKMSGCWLVLFTMNGQTYFGHIGTHDTDIPTTLRVKNAWKMALNHKMITPFRAFQPKNQGPELSNLFAALSEKGTFYSIGFTEPKAWACKVTKRTELAG